MAAVALSDVGRPSNFSIPAARKGCCAHTPTRRIAGGIFLGSSVIFGSATLYASIAFTVTPITAATAVISGLALITVALAVTGYFLYRIRSIARGNAPAVVMGSNGSVLRVDHKEAEEKRKVSNMVPVAAVVSPAATLQPPPAAAAPVVIAAESMSNMTYDIAMMEDQIEQGWNYQELHKRYGFTLCRCSTMNPALREKLVKLFEKLNYSLLTSEKFTPDRKYLGISPERIKKILTLRWGSKTIAEIFQKVLRKDCFLASMGKELNPREWTTRALEAIEGMPVREAIKHFHELFEKGILMAEDRLDGQPSIRERFLTEIEGAHTWEELLEGFTDGVIGSRILPRNHPYVERLVTTYVMAHVDTHISNSSKLMTWPSLVIERYSFMPEKMLRFLEAPRAEYRVAVLRYAEAQKCHQATFEDAVHEGMTFLKAHLERNEVIEGFTSRRNELSDEIKKILSKPAEQRLFLIAKQRSLTECQAQLKERSEQLAEAQKSLAAAIPEIQLKEQVDTITATIIAKKADVNSLKEEVSRDPKMEGELRCLEWELERLSNLAKESAALKKQVETLSKEVQSSESHIASLIVSISTGEDELVKLQVKLECVLKNLEEVELHLCQWENDRSKLLRVWNLSVKKLTKEVNEYCKVKNTGSESCVEFYLKQRQLRQDELAYIELMKELQIITARFRVQYQYMRELEATADRICA